jgi:hypothetical protein
LCYLLSATTIFPVLASRLRAYKSAERSPEVDRTPTSPVAAPADVPKADAHGDNQEPLGEVAWWGKELGVATSAALKGYAAVVAADQVLATFGMILGTAQSQAWLALGKLLTLAVSLGDRFVPARRIPFREGETNEGRGWTDLAGGSRGEKDATRTDNGTTSPTPELPPMRTRDDPGVVSPAYAAAVLPPLRAHQVDTAAPVEPDPVDV